MARSKRNKKKRRSKKGKRPPYRIMGDDAVFIDEGYSPEELEEQMRDPHSRLRKAIDDAKLCKLAGGVNDPALANWAYVIASLAHVPYNEVAEADLNMNALRLLSRELGAARVIDLPGNVYGELFHAVDVYTCEEIGGLPWVAPDQIARFDRDGGLDATNKILEAHDGLAYPERLPFERTYFAFGSPAPILAEDSASYIYRINKLNETDAYLGRAVDPDEPVVMRVLGYLVCESGVAAEFVQLTRPNGQSGVAPFEVHWPIDQGNPGRTGWSNAFLLNAWILRALVDLVNNYRSICVTQHNPSILLRRQLRKQMRKRKVQIIPRPYYRVRLQTTITHKSWQETRERLEQKDPRRMEYRHDVRGHERVYLDRGSKPLADDVRDALIAKGYRLYLDAVEPSDVIRMSARGVKPKQPHEWIAIKHTWVKAHISPRDDSLPYVPSIHEVPKERSGKVEGKLG